MLGQFENFNQQQNKGLFTFYREQAEKQQEIKRMKKERKLAKIKQAQLKKARDVQSTGLVRQSNQQKQQLLDPEARPNQLKSERSRKNLYQPKNRRQKYNKQQLGTSVVIVNNNQFSNEHRSSLIPKSIEQKNHLRRIEQMINPHNNNRYFLQNKQLPITFGRGSLQKLITRKQQQQKQQAQQKVKNTIKQSYFNSYSTQSQKKYIPTFSYQKLPQLIKSKPAHSQMIFPKRYKSKKVQFALKSNNSELIRQIRESLRQQSILDKYSYIDANVGIQTSQQTSIDKQYQYRLNSQLDAKQRKLIQILRNGSLARKKYS